MIRFGLINVSSTLKATRVGRTVTLARKSGQPTKTVSARQIFRFFASQPISNAQINDIQAPVKPCCAKKAQDVTPTAPPAPEKHDTVVKHHKSEELSALDAKFWNDRAIWRTAAANTFRCLVGCSIGDFGMLFYLNAFHPGLGMLPIMAISMASGIATSVSLETVMLKVQQKLSWKNSFSMAVGMSMISMLTMEAVESIVDLSMYGGGVALDDPFWWTALGVSLLAGFLSPMPYNYYRLKKYKKACH